MPNILNVFAPKVQTAHSPKTCSLSQNAVISARDVFISATISFISLHVGYKICKFVDIFKDITETHTFLQSYVYAIDLKGTTTTDKGR